VDNALMVDVRLDTSLDLLLERAPPAEHRPVPLICGARAPLKAVAAAPDA
jgi:hypothetical protein